MQLRPYQSAATDAALAHIRQSVSPCVIDAAPAAGKSFIIAALSAALRSMSGGKRVLVLAPSAELVHQDREKFLLTGNPASMFSASGGAKDLRHPVVFGTPKTVRGRISAFCRSGQDGYCAVIIDECHGITPTIREIIEEMKRANPNLRVIGLSGTPYRLNEGYIFSVWPDGDVNDDGATRDPYFSHLVYRVSAQEMLREGFITPMTIGAINAESYDTGSIRLLANGSPRTEDVERAFEGHGRKTAAAVSDVIYQAGKMNGGVMYFAATVQHAHEVLASLPPDNSGLVTGQGCVLRGRAASRKEVVSAYRDEKVRHLVSVGTLTTGFDVGHTSVIALMRYTESAALLQQIMGRAWRLHPGKASSLLLDYAGNVDRHFPDGDIYSPVIRAKKKAEKGEGIEATCPDCGHCNGFSIRPEVAEAGYGIDPNGYCTDLDGNRIETDHGPMPAHFGRRCWGMIRQGPLGEYERCLYRWTGKDCPACGGHNDIAARYCYACRAEIVDPNEKLAIEFRAMKRDPSQTQTDEIVSMECKPGTSASGNKTVRIDITTPFRSFSVWLLPDGRTSAQMREYHMFMEATQRGSARASTVTYYKAENGFYRVTGWNAPADAEPEPSQTMLALSGAA